MTVETATNPSQLNTTWPQASDMVSEGDNHIRLLKTVVKTTFPNVSGAVSASHTELNYLTGVSSGVQSQIDSKGAITGQSWTGTHAFGGAVTVPTLAPGNSTVGAASTAFVQGEWAARMPNYTGPISASTTELNYLVGVVSPIQAQIFNQVAGPVHAAPSKATPDDADEFGFTDSTASWVLRKFTWANIKSLLNAYLVPATGAVTRTLQAKASDVVSVKDFGAVGDGSTDDTAAFTAAVTWLSGLGGGTIFVPRGTYKITEVTIAGGQILVAGDGPETVLAAGAANKHAIQFGDGVTTYFGGGIRNLRIGGASGVVGVNGQIGLSVKKMGQFSIRDVSALPFPAALHRGIVIESSSQFVLAAVAASNCTAFGVTLRNTVDAYVTDCRSDANAGGWLLDGTEGGYFKTCTAYANTSVGWTLQSAVPATRQNKNNWFLACVGDTSGSYNWLISDSRNSRFVSCWGGTQISTATNTFASGFLITSQYSRNLWFTSCAAINNNKDGFQIFDAGGSPPTDIHLLHCQYGSNAVDPNGNGKSGSGYGLDVNGAVDRLRVVGGVFAGNASGPVASTSSGTDIIFSGNPVGLPTSRTGSVTLTAASTTTTVNHGLGVTPVSAGIRLTPLTNGATSGTTAWWVTSITSTQFTINVNANTAGITFAWHASAPGN